MVAAAGGKVNRHAHVLLQQEQQQVKTLTDQRKDRRRNKCCSLPDCIGQNALLAEEPNASVISVSWLGKKDFQGMAVSKRLLQLLAQRLLRLTFLRANLNLPLDPIM
jgi:hypothetical protein